MTLDEFESLLYEEEGTALDFKRDQYPFDRATKPEKREILKDVLAFANSWRRATAYILVGVKEVKGGGSEVVGVDEHLDGANLQQFVNSKTNRPVDFAYREFSVGDASVGIISIPCQPRPFYLSRAYGGLKLKLRRAEVQELVGAIGADALSGGFNKTAAAEKKAADAWRWIGVVVFGAAIGAAASLFVPLHEATELAQIGAKAVIVIPLVGLGTYALKESGKHRRVQWRNRRLALELASIDPYLALFDDTERNTVKKALVERWFAQPESPLKDEEYSPSALVRLFERALDLLGERS